MAAHRQINAQLLEMSMDRLQRKESMDRHLAHNHLQDEAAALSQIQTHLTKGTPVHRGATDHEETMARAQEVAEVLQILVDVVCHLLATVDEVRLLATVVCRHSMAMDPHLVDVVARLRLLARTAREACRLSLDTDRNKVEAVHKLPIARVMV